MALHDNMQRVKEQQNAKPQIVSKVPVPNTVGCKRTVFVKHLRARVALSAVLSPRRSVDVAYGAVRQFNRVSFLTAYAPSDKKVFEKLVVARLKGVFLLVWDKSWVHSGGFKEKVKSGNEEEC